MQDFVVVWAYSPFLFDFEHSTKAYNQLVGLWRAVIPVGRTALMRLFVPGSAPHHTVLTLLKLLPKIFPENLNKPRFL